MCPSFDRAMTSAERLHWKALEPLSLHHTWPVYEQMRHFELGSILSSAVIDAIPPSAVGVLGFLHAGCWECRLDDNSLNWSGGVYDIFGLPRDAPINREQSVTFYTESSRATMERLRAYAIRHVRGFTLDAEIYPGTGGRRWMRLIAAPVCQDGRVVRLHGLKLII
jgi:PAS domain-containing protein